MPKVKFNQEAVDAATECDCGDERDFSLEAEVVRKHIETKNGDSWCCLFVGEDPKPRPLVPLTGTAKTEWEDRKTAKAAAKAAAITRAPAVEALEAKKAELKTKVVGGGNLSNDDMRDLLELWVQL